MKKYIYLCKDCGSENIQIMVWTNPNTDEIIDDVQGIKENVWCEDCEDHVELVREGINGNR
jgi:hypothetical protein